LTALINEKAIFLRAISAIKSASVILARFLKLTLPFLVLLLPISRASFNAANRPIERTSLSTCLSELLNASINPGFLRSLTPAYPFL
jgi:hypothetical protein